MTIFKSTEQLIREDAVRQALEAAAKAVESRYGNQLYKRAWIIAAGVIRNLKPV